MKTSDRSIYLGSITEDLNLQVTVFGHNATKRDLEIQFNEFIPSIIVKCEVETSKDNGYGRITSSKKAGQVLILCKILPKVIESLGKILYVSAIRNMRKVASAPGLSAATTFLVVNGHYLKPSITITSNASMKHSLR